MKLHFRYVNMITTFTMLSCGAGDVEEGRTFVDRIGRGRGVRSAAGQIRHVKLGAGHSRRFR